MQSKEVVEDPCNDMDDDVAGAANGKQTVPSTLKIFGAKYGRTDVNDVKRSNRFAATSGANSRPRAEPNSPCTWERRKVCMFC